MRCSGQSAWTCQAPWCLTTPPSQPLQATSPPDKLPPPLLLRWLRPSRLPGMLHILQPSRQLLFMTKAGLLCHRSIQPRASSHRQASLPGMQCCAALHELYLRLPGHHADTQQSAECRTILPPSPAEPSQEPLILVSATSQRLPAALQLCQADQIRAVPLDRWDLEGLKARFGGFVADWAHFDANLFGMSASEAAVMEPQQRVLLEVCAWHQRV